MEKWKNRTETLLGRLIMLMTLLENDGLHPKKKGPNEYASSCPACGGRDRLVIRLDGKPRYWCRQCGIHGDAITYLIQFKSMTFPEAAAYTGRTLETIRRPKETRQEAPVKRYDPPPEAWLKQAEILKRWTHDSLLENESVMALLLTERGLTRPTVERFRLGWIRKNLYDQRAAWGLPDELKDDGRRKKLFIPAGLVIPGPSRLRIRRSNPGDHPKYYVVPGSSPAPMTIGTAHETTAVIVESELDALVLAQEISRPVFVVALGSASIKPDSTIAEELVNNLNDCPVVLLALDTDDAGGKAARHWLDGLHNSCRAIIPPSLGKDVTDAFLHGMDLNIWISAAMDLYREESSRDIDQETFTMEGP